MLDEAKLDQKAGNNQVFFSYQHNWPDFFCQKTFFEVLGKGVAWGPALQSTCCFRILG